jgi:hypothetical protein
MGSMRIFHSLTISLSLSDYKALPPRSLSLRPRAPERCCPNPALPKPPQRPQQLRHWVVMPGRLGGRVSPHHSAGVRFAPFPPQVPLLPPPPPSPPLRAAQINRAADTPPAGAEAPAPAATFIVLHFPPTCSKSHASPPSFLPQEAEVK